MKLIILALWRKVPNSIPFLIFAAFVWVYLLVSYWAIWHGSGISMSVNNPAIVEGASAVAFRRILEIVILSIFIGGFSGLFTLIRILEIFRDVVTFKIPLKMHALFCLPIWCSIITRSILAPLTQTQWIYWFIFSLVVLPSTIILVCNSKIILSYLWSALRSAFVRQVNNHPFQRANTRYFVLCFSGYAVQLCYILWLNSQGINIPYLNYLFLLFGLVILHPLIALSVFLFAIVVSNFLIGIPLPGEDISLVCQLIPWVVFGLYANYGAIRQYFKSIRRGTVQYFASLKQTEFEAQQLAKSKTTKPENIEF